jgi:aconitate hydratase
VRAVIAKSFARIHRRNLVAQGIVALTFADERDHGRAEPGQTWTLPRLREGLSSGAETITARIEDTGDELTLSHDFSPKEREVLVCGGLLEYLRRVSDRAG